MISNKRYTVIKTIRISKRCSKAWKYLEKHSINAPSYFREGGEKSVIDKAIR